MRLPAGVRRFIVNALRQRAIQAARRLAAAAILAVDCAEVGYFVNHD